MDRIAVYKGKLASYENRSFKYKSSKQYLGQEAGHKSSTRETLSQTL